MSISNPPHPLRLVCIHLEEIITILPAFLLCLQGQQQAVVYVTNLYQSSAAHLTCFPSVFVSFSFLCWFVLFNHFYWIYYIYTFQILSSSAFLFQKGPLSILSSSSSSKVSTCPSNDAFPFPYTEFSSFPILVRVFIPAQTSWPRRELARKGFIQHQRKSGLELKQVRKQKLILWPWRQVFYWLVSLFPLTYSACSLREAKTNTPAMIPLTLGCVLLCCS